MVNKIFTSKEFFRKLVVEYKSVGFDNKLRTVIRLHTSEFWTEESSEMIFEKIGHETRQVRFGPFNIFDTGNREFTTKWLGQLKPKQNTFKLFRVTGKGHTSEISVNGLYTHRLNKSLVIVKYKLHFTALFGLLGVLTFVFAMWYLLGTKGYVTSKIYLLAGLLCVGIFYALSVVRDLNKSERAISESIYRPYRPVIYDPASEHDDDELTDEDD
jgi:hypothetical protein